MAAGFEIVNFNFMVGLGLSIAVASFGMMLYIAGKQTKQTDDLAVVTKDIEEMISKQDKLINDVRDVYASSIVGYVQLTSRSYHFVIDLYTNKYENGVLSLKKPNIRKMLEDYYDRHLFHLPQIEAMELVKSFGKNMLDKHWRLTPHMKSDMWQAHSDYGMALLIHSYKEQMYKLVELKDAFLEFCDQDLKDKDKELQDRYDLIKKEWEEASTPNRDEFSDEFSVQEEFDADLSSKRQLD